MPRPNHSNVYIPIKNLREVMLYHLGETQQYSIKDFHLLE